MSGAQIGGVIGAVVGAYFGGNWQIGYAIGSAIGGYVDPTVIKGPKLSDATRQTSQEGVPIPFGYGTFPCAGNLIWVADIVEHEQEDDGKGSGTVTKTYTYTRSYAIGICEGPISGLQKIKRNGKLVYDISPTSTITANNSKFLQKCTIYLGDETQLVDPTIEADVGVGNSGPMRGLAYIVVEDDETQAGEVAQYEFVVQMCGAVTGIAGPALFIASGQSGRVSTTTDGENWTLENGGLTGVGLTYVCPDNNWITGFSTSSKTFYYSHDRGENWNASGTFAAAIQMWGMACGNGYHVGVSVIDGSGTTKAYVSANAGLSWAEVSTSILYVRDIAFGNGKFVAVTYEGQVWTSGNGLIWANTADVGFPCRAVGFNGAVFMAVGDLGDSCVSADGTTWGAINPLSIGLASLISVCGGPGFFCVSTDNVGAGAGVYRTTSNGATWTQVISTGNSYVCAHGSGITIFGNGSFREVSLDSGVTWDSYSDPHTTTVSSIEYIGPYSGWYTVPDADNVYVDADGEIITEYVVGTEIASCGAILWEIVEDLCERDGIDLATEIDTSELTDFVAGFKCATESGADGYIESLTLAFRFDRGEWDKKLRFPKRGGAVVAALTTDDLVARSGPAISQTLIQEPELLRKINLMTIDPAADYAMTKQTWQRRSGTINAKGESSLEIPIVTSADTAAQMAEIRGKIAWSETIKLGYCLGWKWSKLVPTNIVTVTDKRGVTHRVRLTDMSEVEGVHEVTESIKDRAAIYVGHATGVVNDNTGGTTTPGLIGPTLFMAMNLPQIKSADNTSGMYIGACGILDGWQGCQILLSVDGGLSYTVAKTITVPTKLGFLTADVDATGSSSEPLAVHIYGGALTSATAGQVLVGANLSAVATDHGTAGVIAEVLAYETASESPADYYALTTLTRGMKETDADDHFTGDEFMDLNSSYFLPIPVEFIGQTLYFKAVGFGVSPDAVAPYTVVYEGIIFVIDGGGA